jgi:hypothetical protein
MPKAKAKAKAKPAAKAARAKAQPTAKPQLDRYAYLPTDLQRAAVFMDRGDFLRKLQKGQHDREYRHVATHGAPPLSVDKDLQEKIAALSAEIESLRGRPPAPFRKNYAPSSASMTPSTAVPGSRVTVGGSSSSAAPGSRVSFGGFSASRTPFVIPTDDDL